MAGYVGRSMSVNAMEAHNEGRKPSSRITKQGKGVLIMKRILCALLIVVCLVSYAWSTATSGAEVKIFKPQDLPNAFAENPSEARNQYMGKTVQIKGIVVDKGMSRYMTPYVELSESGKEPTPARCVLPYNGLPLWNRREQLSDFEIGQTVTFTGRVHVLYENLVLLKDSMAAE